MKFISHEHTNDHYLMNICNIDSCWFRSNILYVNTFRVTFVFQTCFKFKLLESSKSPVIST